jgi:hypothetical protein
VQPEGIVGVSFFSIFMVWIVAHYTWATIKGWQDVALKRDMVARGYSAQEIVRVVSARKGSRSADTLDVPPAKPIRQPSYTP